MKIKLDENISRHLKKPLAGEGHTVFTVADEGLLSRSDEEVAAAASAEGWVLFTLDLEFGDLRKHPPGSHPGIVLFRPQTFGPLGVNRFILDFVRQADLQEFASCVVVAEPGRVRVRRPISLD